MPLFSVIIPVYNREKLIGGAIDSVLAQELSDFELIVVDDGSTDQTPQIVSQYVERHPGRITLLQQSNGGPGAARNAGIAKAAGRYITFLDSDDLWFPWALASHARVIEEFGSPGFISGDFVPLDASLNVEQNRARPWKAQAYPNFLVAGMKTFPIGGTPSVAVDARFVREVGGFAQQFINGEDQHLWLRLGCVKGFVRIQEPPLYARRQQDSRISDNMERNLVGIRFLASQERAGSYPGGKEFRPSRLRIITGGMLSISLGCLERRQFAEAWAMYKEAFAWNLKLFRWKYLLAFPWLILINSIKPKAQTGNGRG